MLKFKQKLLLFATIGFIIAINTACEDNNNPPTPPKWELPQPMDTLLFGSWELIKDGMLDVTAYRNTITFYNDNKYDIRNKYNDIRFDEYYWSINDDTLIMPSFFNIRTGHFVDYKYNISKDGELLYVELVDYPIIYQCLDYSVLSIPLCVASGVFKRIEAE